MGAYTERWAGLSPELGLEASSGAYVMHRGRVHTAPRPDLLTSMRNAADGGTGVAREFWRFCES